VGLPFPDTAATPRYGNLQQALTYALDQLELNGKVALEITTSETLTLPAADSLGIDLPSGTTLEFRAADGARPTLQLNTNRSERRCRQHFDYEWPGDRRQPRHDAG